MDYRNMFNYSVSQPWHPMEKEWSSDRNHNTRNQRNYVQYPVLLQWHNPNMMDTEELPGKRKHKHMPSSNRRSQSSRRTIQTRQRSRSLNATAAAATAAATADNQNFIIILTNHPEILRHRMELRIRADDSTDQVQQPPVQTNHYGDLNDREDILVNLLRIDLNEVIQDYLSRTRHSLPIHLILEASSNITGQQ